MPYGFSFSWKRAMGLSASQARLSRSIGIPISRSGRRAKVNGHIANALLGGRPSARGKARAGSSAGRLAALKILVAGLIAWLLLCVMLAMSGQDRPTGASVQAAEKSRATGKRQ